MLGSDKSDDRSALSSVAEDWEFVALPPPPEISQSGHDASLPWAPSAPSGVRSQLARHPLLVIADSAVPLQGQSASRSHRGSILTESLAGLRRHVRAPSWTRSSPETATVLPGRRGDPLVVVVAGGRGGVGRTTLAAELATALAGNGVHATRRVLLVDADRFRPDLDVKLGIADLEADRYPGARTDRVLLQLPELADRRLNLDSILWVNPLSGVRALLAPTQSKDFGREHLDYLYTYILAPEFDAIVVDAGPAIDLSTQEVGGPGSFWLTLARSVLVPLRPTLSHARSACVELHLFQRMGVPIQRCRLVMGVARSESSSADKCQRLLSDFVVIRWPWVPDAAYKATNDLRPLADIDRGLGQSIQSLVADVTDSQRRGG